MATKQTELKPKCKYGAKCYRRNADHLKAYSHPKRKADDEDDGDDKEQETKKDEAVKKPKLKAETSKEMQAVESDEEREETPLGNISPKPEECSDTDSEEDDDHDLDPNSVDEEEFIKRKFLVEMPSDFYEFWKFCEKLKPSAPTDALKKSLGFQLVGPFDVLSGKHKNPPRGDKHKKPNYLRHWRYYYDPPEFMTVIRGDDSTQFHIGYYRDDPKDMPVFLASNSAKLNGTLSPRGDNLFATVLYYLKEKLKEKDLSSSLKQDLENLCEKVKDTASNLDLSLDTSSKKMKARQKKVVCPTLHGAGIVVPVDENEVGYRPVPETPGDLKKILKKIVDSKTETERNKNFDPLQELITLVQFANDECDYGEGLELGLDLFTFGGKLFHSTILHLLPLAYQFLRRPQYAKVIAAHLKKRQHTAVLSELD